MTLPYLLSKKKKFGFGIVVLLFFVFVIASSDGTVSTQTSDKKTLDWSDASSEEHQKILDETENSWLDGFTYDEMMRYNEKYVGNKVHLRGQVLQVQKIYGDEYSALVFTKCEKFIEFFCNDDLVWINYSDVKMLEDDFISFWGEVKGLKNYETASGIPQTVPEVDASAIHITN